MLTDLPNAAWFAEHAMRWHKDVHHPDEFPNDTPCWMDDTGTCQQHLRACDLSIAWDPRTNDADALQMWEHVVPNPKQLDWAFNGLVYAIWADCALGGATMRNAICGAVEAYVSARDVHNTGTDEEKLCDSGKQ